MSRKLFDCRYNTADIANEFRKGTLGDGRNISEIYPTTIKYFKF
jgi:hypothetical protein